MASLFCAANTQFEIANFEKSLTSVEDFDCCILDIDFENQAQLELGYEFVYANRHLNFYAYIAEGTKEAVINAHKLGCTKFFIKAEDLKEYLHMSSVQMSQMSMTTFTSGSRSLYREFSGFKVLLVDDVEINLKLLKDVLSPFNFEFHAFTSSTLASEEINKTKYDLILTDAMMPEVSGFELAKMVKDSKLNQNTPTVFVSGYPLLDNKIESYNLGSVAFIEKPLEPAAVRAQIYSILKTYHLQMEIVSQKEDFIAMLTHDLKTPIRAQIAALRLLSNGCFGKLNFEQAEIVNEIMASNKYMQNMTDNVLLKYKSERGKLQIQKETHNIKDTIESTLSKLKYLVAQKRQTIKVNYDLTSEQAYYDEIEIQRVLTNLIVNATEYSPENSAIGINVKSADAEILISVEDSGCGMNEEEFELFIKKYTSQAKTYKKIGTGLGLYICKKIVDTHGGSMSVEKLPKAGSRFTFTIPNDTLESGGAANSLNSQSL
ncbi:signal transduction histidine kinase [Candidatus Gastranaerophilus sp. (ex Termes propinquus)]|nr:signal transduction histidine kinase [Candidatus Gastranaerophilus sp. (ex Termes propinquus)]